MFVKQTVLLISLSSCILKVVPLPTPGSGDGLLGASISLGSDSKGQSAVSIPGAVVSSETNRGALKSRSDDGARLDGNALYLGLNSELGGSASPQERQISSSSTNGNLGLSLNANNGGKSVATVSGTGQGSDSGHQSTNSEAHLSVKPKVSSNIGGDISTGVIGLSLGSGGTGDSNLRVSTSSNLPSENSQVVASPQQSSLSIQSSPVGSASTINTDVHDSIGSTGVHTSVKDETPSLAYNPKSQSKLSVSVNLGGITDKNPAIVTTIKPIEHARITQVVSTAADVHPKVSSSADHIGSSISVAQPHINGQVATQQSSGNSISSQVSPLLQLNSGINPGLGLATIAVPVPVVQLTGSGTPQNPSSNINAGLSLGGSSGRITAIPVYNLPTASQNIQGSIVTSQNPDVGLKASASSIPSVSSAVNGNSDNSAHISTSGRGVASQTIDTSINSQAPSSVLSLGINSAVTPSVGLSNAIDVGRPNYPSTSSGIFINPLSNLDTGLYLGGGSGRFSATPVYTWPVTPQAIQGSIYSSQNPLLGLRTNTNTNLNPVSSISLNGGNTNNAALISSSLSSGRVSTYQPIQVHEASPSVLSLSLNGGVTPSLAVRPITVPVVRPVVISTSSGRLQNPTGGLQISLGGSPRYQVATPVQVSSVTYQPARRPYSQNSRIGLSLSNGLSSETSGSSALNSPATISVAQNNAGGNTAYVAVKSAPANDLNLSTKSSSTSAGVSGNIEGANPNYASGLEISSSGTGLRNQISSNALLSPSVSSSLSLAGPVQSNSQVDSTLASQNSNESSPSQSAELDISSSGTSVESQGLLNSLLNPSGSSSLSVGGPTRSDSYIDSSLGSQNVNTNQNAGLDVYSSGTGSGSQSSLNVVLGPSGGSRVSLESPAQSSSQIATNVGGTDSASYLSINNQGSAVDASDSAGNGINISAGLNPSLGVSSNGQTDSLGQSQLTLQQDVLAASVRPQSNADVSLGLSL